MIRDFASFTALAVFLYGMAFALPGLAEMIHGNHSAIVAANERN